MRWMIRESCAFSRCSSRFGSPRSATTLPLLSSKVISSSTFGVGARRGRRLGTGSPPSLLVECSRSFVAFEHATLDRFRRLHALRRLLLKDVEHVDYSLERDHVDGSVGVPV